MAKTKDFDFDGIFNSSTQIFQTEVNDTEKKIDKVNTNDVFSWQNPDEIEINVRFSSLFKIRDEVLKAIINDMLNNGYRQDKPVIVWKEENCLIEGHTRLMAAKKLCLKVAVIFKSFESEESAIKFAIKEQYNRRNQSDSDNLHTIVNSPFFKNVKNKKKAIAEFLNVSAATASKYTKLINADKKIINCVIDGIITVNKAYNSLEKERKYTPKKFTNSKNSENVATIKSDDSCVELKLEYSSDDNELHRNELKQKPETDFLSELKERLSIGEEVIAIRYVLNRLIGLQ